MGKDIKENEMQNGSPTLLRGLDAEGNSVVIPTRDLAGLIMSPYKIVSDIIHVPADKCLKIGSFSLDELGYGFSTINLSVHEYNYGGWGDRQASYLFNIANESADNTLHGTLYGCKTMFSEAYIKQLRSTFERDGIFRDLYLDFNMECFVSIDAKVISWVNIEISDELNAGAVKNILHGTIQYLNQ